MNLQGTCNTRNNQLITRHPWRTTAKTNLLLTTPRMVMPMNIEPNNQNESHIVYKDTYIVGLKIGDWIAHIREQEKRG
jgi:hypothetical protein